jgi:hypothetical protein
VVLAELLGNCVVTRLYNNRGSGVFCDAWSVPRLCKSQLLQFLQYLHHTRVEAGSNTSTVTLRVVGGYEKGSLESETLKYGHEFYGTRK